MKVILSCWSVFPFHGVLGLQKYVYHLARHLVQQGVDVEIVTSRDKSGERKRMHEGIKYVFIPPRCFGRPFNSFWQQIFAMSLARYLQRVEFDVLHSFTKAAYSYLHCQDRKPTIVQPFGLEPFQAPSQTQRKGIQKIYLDILSRRSWRYCLSHADTVASEGQFQNEQLIRLGVPEERLFILPVGIDISFIGDKISKHRIGRAELGLVADDLVLICVNRFAPDRGLKYLVEAFRLVKEKLKRARLIIAGEVNMKLEATIYEQVLNQLRAYDLLPDVICQKNVPEELLYSYYALSDIYVSPTLLEDFLMSIQEAMACGLPVVSTGQEFLVKPGVNGYIVPRRDPRAMAEAVITMYRNNECKTMGSRSLEMVKEYDFSVIAGQAIKKYEELLLNKKGGLLK